jgi:hypothetical protein
MLFQQERAGQVPKISNINIAAAFDCGSGNDDITTDRDRRNF